MSPSFVQISIIKILLFIASFDGEPEPSWRGKMGAALGVLLLAGFGYHAWLNKDDFRITIRSGRVAFHGRFPPACRAIVGEFLLRDVSLEGTVRVIGNWSTAPRVLKIVVQGNVPPGDCQRIRNFMKLTLKG